MWLYLVTVKDWLFNDLIYEDTGKKIIPKLIENKIDYKLEKVEDFEQDEDYPKMKIKVKVESIDTLDIISHIVGCDLILERQENSTDENFGHLQAIRIYDGVI